MSHVLAVRLDSEGDVLLAGPAIRALAAGSQRVTLWCGPRGRQAAHLLPGVDRVLVAGVEWIDPEPSAIDPRRTAALVDELASAGADRAVIFTSFHQSPLPTALLLRLAGVGQIAAISEDYPGSLLDVRHRVADDLHEVERGLSVARAVGCRLPASDDGRLAIRRWPQRPPRLPGPYVVVHPGASVPARAWDPGRCAELVGQLARQGWRVAITGGPDERSLTAQVAAAGGDRAVDLGGRTSFTELAAILADAAAVVVGNTGPAHLAAAVGAPVVSLFAPTVPAVRWRPWKVPHELLFADVPCAGCRSRACPVAGHPCLAGVSVPDVLAAVERLARSRQLETVG